MKRALSVALLLALTVACKRTPPKGSGAIETTGQSPGKGGDDLGRGHTMAPFPSGAVLVTDATTCTVSRFEGISKGALWSVILPQCEGVLEAAIAPDSVSFVRTPTALVAIGPDGKERWRLSVGNEPLPRGLMVPAVTLDSMVIVASTSRVVMAFKNEGVQAWRFSVGEDETLVAPPLGSRGEGVFLLTNRAIYNVGSDGTLRYRKPQAPA
jgi:hypothetical protein